MELLVTGKAKWGLLDILKVLMIGAGVRSSSICQFSGTS